jgi:dTDP-4-dehydrorhamnose reductase
MLGSMLVSYLSQYYTVIAPGRADLAPLPRADWTINAIGTIPQRLPPERRGLLQSYLEANVDLLKRLAKRPNVIQIATDCVYDGKDGGYTERDCYSPSDTYGYSKTLSELVKGPTYLRCSIIGKGPQDDYSLLGWFLSQPQDATVQGFTNHQWNGLTTLHFAKLCRVVMENFGELHVRRHLIPSDSVSKYELLCLFRRYFRPDMTVVPVEAPQAIDRTLATIYPSDMAAMWSLAGYRTAPTIEQMVAEFAEFYRRHIHG